MTRFFAIPGCAGVVYWHQRFVDSYPELKWTNSSDERLANNPPWFYLEEYPSLEQEIRDARPVYVPDENLETFLHVDVLLNVTACEAHMNRNLQDPDFERIAFRRADTHEVIHVTTSASMAITDTATECLIKLRGGKCFLYRAAGTSFIIIETARQ